MPRYLWSDILYAVRTLRRQPTLSAVSILTLGLGIGLATAVFSLVNGVLLKGLPFDESHRIVLVAGVDAASGDRLRGVSVHDFAVLEERQKVFDAVGAFRWVSTTLSWDRRDPERFAGAALTVGALRAMRVKPLLGRLFRGGDDRPGADPVILIGYRLWRDAFAGAPDAVGRTVVANGVARTVVGVMPERFGFPDREQVWIPLVIDPRATARGRGPQYEVIGRLGPGVSIDAAQSQMTSLAASLARDFPDTNRRLRLRVTPFMERVFGSRIRILMTTMLGVGVGVLLVAAGLMVKTVAQIRSSPPPFAVDGVATAWIDLPRDRFPDGAARSGMIDQVVARLGSDPGIEAAAIADGLPADVSDVVPVQPWGVAADGGSDFPLARRGRVTPDYFRTFHVPVLQGRGFTALDQPDQTMVAVVNESFRRRFLPGGNAIGRRFRQAPPEANHPWLTVVGVVPDLLMQGFRSDLGGGAGYYVPLAQAAGVETVAIAVRGTAGVTVPSATLRTLVASLGQGLAVWNAQSMRAFVDQQAMFYEVFGAFFSGLGGAGLLLAAAGLYGVVSFSVARRTRELAIRAALGASRSGLTRLVMRSAAIQAGIGLALGLALGLLATAPLGPLLYQVHPRDPSVLVTAAIALGGTSLAAALLGVRRIVRLDPASILGEE